MVIHAILSLNCVHRPVAAYVPAVATAGLFVEGHKQHHHLKGAATAALPSVVGLGGCHRRTSGGKFPKTRLNSRQLKDEGGSLSEDNAAGTPLGGKGALLAAGLTALATASVAAKAGILPGPLDPSSGAILPYTDAMILRDVGATLLCLILAVIFVKANTAAAAAGIIESRDSRKIIHTLSAPLFVVFWPAFSNAVGARFFAAIVPFMNGLRLVQAAKGGENGDEKELASAVSRSGDASEALGGPFVYVLVLFSSIIAFWTDDLTGVVAVSTMAAGDGVADLIGRRFGANNKWFFNQSKSIAGTTAFAIAAALTSTGLAWWLGHTGALVLPMAFVDVAVRVVAISIVCAFVELIPFGDDNWTVPLSAAVLTAATLH